MLKTLSRFRRADSGLAAVEFAFIVPIMITMVFGAIEVTNGVICKSDVSQIASTASDLVAQKSSVTTSDLNDVFAATNALIYPFAAANAKVIISSIIDDGKGGGKIGWSVAQNATKHTKGAAMTVPPGLLTSGGSVIYVEVNYSYDSLTSFVMPDITMTNNFYTHPRRVQQIPCPDC